MVLIFHALNNELSIAGNPIDREIVGEIIQDATALKDSIVELQPLYTLNPLELNYLADIVGAGAGDDTFECLARLRLDLNSVLERATLASIMSTPTPPDPTYEETVLAQAGLLEYWDTKEVSGTTVNAAINSARNGAYVNGVLVGSTTFLDNDPAPAFDGVNDFINNDTANMDTIAFWSAYWFSGWFRVANAGVWTDNTIRCIARISSSSVDQCRIDKENENNNLRFQIDYNSVEILDYIHVTSTTNWFHVFVTAQDNTQPGGGKWLVAIDGVTISSGTHTTNAQNNAVKSLFSIGSSNAAGANGWSGSIARVAFGNSYNESAAVALYYNGFA